MTGVDWSAHDRMWRRPSEVAGFPGLNTDAHAEGLLGQTHGDWWDLLDELGVTLLASREYEHTLIALAASAGAPEVTYLPMPHPSGIAVDLSTSTVHVAGTRNPNQVIDLRASGPPIERCDAIEHTTPIGTLVPVSARFYPGSLYLHDLAMIGGELHGNAVGHNCIVRLPPEGGFERVWWPECIDRGQGPDFSCNHLQLNSIAPGPSLAQSWFSASTDVVAEPRPGHPDFPVDGRGVIFSGATREVVHRGLTRPHSARLHKGELWVADSGYGRLVRYRGGQAEVVVELPGWTRGLCFVADYAFVGTSRVIPRFRQYAPGLPEQDSLCGLHAVDLATGEVVASLSWPSGNQIFAIEALPAGFTAGLPGRIQPSGAVDPEPGFYYSFSTRRTP